MCGFLKEKPETKTPSSLADRRQDGTVITPQKK